MKQNENKTDRQIIGTDADIDLANRINDCISIKMRMSLESSVLRN